MRILGIDFETTGLDPKTDRIIEVGAVLWDWDTCTPVRIISNLVIPDTLISDEITKLTGITNGLVAEFGVPEREAICEVELEVDRADFTMAHNGTDFDKLFYDASLLRLGLKERSTPWLDSRTDILYPESITVRKLGHLAADHGFLNPFPHRAVFDVLTMLKIANCYRIEDIIARASEPTLYVQAIVSFDDKDKAKARGYYWHSTRRIWWRAFKESDFSAERDACGFRTAILQGSPA